MDRIMVISSDGHATARMDDYAPYLDQEFREEFRDFCAVYRERGTHTFELYSPILAAQLGYSRDQAHVLVPPLEDKFPRGDVHKPLGGANIG